MVMEDTLGTFSKDFNQCESSSAESAAILNVLFTHFRPRNQETKEVYWFAESLLPAAKIWTLKKVFVELIIECF